MGSTIKKMTVILLLAAVLAPGVAQARVFAWESATVSRNIEGGFFGMVWNLLANMFEKNGGMLDPNGEPLPTDSTGDDTTTTTTTTSGGSGGYNGGLLDPNG